MIIEATQTELITGEKLPGVAIVIRKDGQRVFTGHYMADGHGVTCIATDEAQAAVYALITSLGAI